MKVPPHARLRLAVRGAVQGVGFRPFVFRLADELCLRGWVRNSPQGVLLEVEGPRAAAEKFLIRLEAEKPARSFIQGLETSWFEPAGYSRFEILPSREDGGQTALVLPDIATCPDCLRELFDPNDRRFRYPFTNCTHCGPRFSIIEALPYDRANTSMSRFVMCPQCRAEYEDPRDRRFHAQPNACPGCGPHLEFWTDAGETLCAREEALAAAVRAIRSGQILALKGLGGFQLVVDAGNENALRRLRTRKHREEKPLAVMFPSLESVRKSCRIAPQEVRLLRSAEAPIVLLEKKRTDSFIAGAVAPGNPNLGVMLPYTPLHHLILAELGIPVVMTSGNLSDEPLCTDEHEALGRLGGIADVFLVHNRPIVRHGDDSVARVVLGRQMILRRARGYAPLPVPAQGADGRGQSPETGAAGNPTHAPSPPAILAVGAHLKNAIALAVGHNVFISQHIGDLETAQAGGAFRRVVRDFGTLFRVAPQVIAADLHPDYFSTRYARSLAAAGAGAPGAPEFFGVQHHVAHVLSCIAENEMALPALGVAWDGTGYGGDGTIWGGEFFRVTADGVERFASLRPFRLPGGDKAVREPRRSAIGLLFELFNEAAFAMAALPPLRGLAPAEAAALKALLTRPFNSPLSSSAGRLFDAVSALVGLRQVTTFEAQAAMELEFAMGAFRTSEFYPLAIAEGPLLVLDWQPMIEGILSDLRRRAPIAEISGKFHNGLAEAIAAVARRSGQRRVALSGGCFQNRRLIEHVVGRLRAENFQPCWHQRLPPNDGGIALGQVVAALRSRTRPAAALPRR